MQISKDTVVSFHYELFEEDAQLETSGDAEPLLYLHGKSGMLQGLQDALEDKLAGDELSVSLKPEQAYGYRQDVKPERIPIKHLQTKTRLAVGDSVQINTQQGPRDVQILKVGRFNVDVDPNHPFAGKTLRFEIRVLGVREATAEELAHGHAHGAGGHQH